MPKAPRPVAGARLLRRGRHTTMPGGTSFHPGIVGRAFMAVTCRSAAGDRRLQLAELVVVGARVVIAEYELPAALEDDPDVCFGTATVAAIRG